MILVFLFPEEFKVLLKPLVDQLRQFVDDACKEKKYG
jgi:hypothetical protein